MSADFKFEYERISNNRWNRFIIFLLLLSSLFSVYFGVSEYSGLKNETKNFVQTENKLLEHFVLYSQYGDKGFRILFSPPQEGVLFFYNELFSNLYSKIDMSEVIRVYNSYKGEKIFSINNKYLSFSWVVFFLFSLYILFIGLTAYSNENQMFKFSHILIRMLILNLIILFIMLLSYSFSLILGSNISGIIGYFFFCIMALFLLNFFYLIGFLMRTIFTNQFYMVLTSLVVWIVSLLIIPGIFSQITLKKSHNLPSVDNIDIIKSERLFEFERSGKKALAGIDSTIAKNLLSKKLANDFLKNEYDLNIKLEKNLFSNVRALVDNLEKTAILFPTTHFDYMAGEISGCGYNEYLRFVEHIISLHQRFVKFILERKFDPPPAKLECFIKNGENVFHARSHIPRNFWIGLLITLGYSVILLLASFFIITYRKKQKKETIDPSTIDPDLDLKEGKMVYLQCEDANYKQKIFDFYKQNPDAVCIDQFKGEEVDPGIPLRHFFSYLTEQGNITMSKAHEYLEMLGIDDLKNFPHSPEAIKKIFCAVTLAQKKNLFVLNDLILNESKRFERKFLAILEDMIKKQNKTIIYLGLEFPNIHCEMKEITEFKIFQKIDVGIPTQFEFR